MESRVLGFGLSRCFFVLGGKFISWGWDGVEVVIVK